MRVCLFTYERLEIQKIQQNARGYLESILKEHESTALHLKAQSKELEEREKELEKRQALNENEIRKLSAEKEMVLQFRLLANYLPLLNRIAWRLASTYSV